MTFSLCALAVRWCARWQQTGRQRCGLHCSPFEGSHERPVRFFKRTLLTISEYECLLVSLFLDELRHSLVGPRGVLVKRGHAFRPQMRENRSGLWGFAADVGKWRAAS